MTLVSYLKIKMFALCHNFINEVKYFFLSKQLFNLQKSLAVLAQWPLKSVRYYESTGKGQFSIEAGKVAPMGEGHYVFFARPGMDNKLYDVVDNYIVNTLDRVKVSFFSFYLNQQFSDISYRYYCINILVNIFTPSN